MTFDAVDFILIIPSLLHFLHREPIDVLCAHLGPSFFFFSSFTAVLSIGQRHVARFFPLPFEQSK